MERGLPDEKDLNKDPFSLYEEVAYDKFWTGLQKRKLDELEHALVKELLPASGRRIIDVGCGYGRLADCYLEKFDQVVMVDGSMSLLQQAYENTKGQASYIACDVRRLPFRTASFDSILMIRVFHHLEDSRTCLSELHRLLCKGGSLVFSYCNKQNARRVIQWLIGADSENPFTPEPAGAGSTMISHHPKYVHRLLSETGFSRMKYYGAGVMDRLAGRFGRADMGIKPARDLAPFFASSRIAPWILCQAIATGTTDLFDARSVGDLLCCPSCGGDLNEEELSYGCTLCERIYPIRDGIIDLRVK